MRIFAYFFRLCPNCSFIMFNILIHIKIICMTVTLSNFSGAISISVSCVGIIAPITSLTFHPPFTPFICTTVSQNNPLYVM